MLGKRYDDPHGWLNVVNVDVENSVVHAEDVVVLGKPGSRISNDIINVQPIPSLWSSYLCLNSEQFWLLTTTISSFSSSLLFSRSMELYFTVMFN